MLSTSFLCHSCVHQFHLTESKTKENCAYITVAIFPQGPPEPATGADRSVEGDDILMTKGGVAGGLRVMVST